MTTWLVGIAIAILLAGAAAAPADLAWVAAHPVIVLLCIAAIALTSALVAALRPQPQP